MPEHAETKLLSDFARHVLTDRRVISIAKNPKSKNVDFDESKADLLLPAIVTVLHKGKETLFIFEVESLTWFWKMRVQYGMSGHWEHHRTRFGNKHSLLSLELDSGTFLEFVDPRRFGRWVFGGQNLTWSSVAPDPFEYGFPDYVMNCQSIPKYGKKLLCEVLLDQQVFWGVGNYVRAEVCYRANVNPFKRFDLYTIAEMNEIVHAARNVMHEAYLIGGGKLFTWKNPLSEDVPDASEWLKCYQKGEWCIDRTGRRFWYDVKWKSKCPYTQEAPPKKLRKKKAGTE
jgi:endonuclease VIII-like 1